MSKQLIIAVSREYATGGHDISELLAKKFNLPLYDKNLLEEIAVGKNSDVEEFRKYDEAPKYPFFHRSVRGFTNSPAANIAEMQFDLLREKAAAGESFVVVGRCAETVLKDFDCMIPIFILADEDYKIGRIVKDEYISESEARALMKRRNRKRKSYHNLYCDVKWGDSRNYDISINSARLGTEGTADFLEDYIRRIWKEDEE